MARGTVTMNPLSDATNPPEEAKAEREPGQAQEAFAETVAKSLRERVKQRELTHRELDTVEAAFNRIDVDGSGWLSREELLQDLQVNSDITGEQAGYIIRQMDADGSGKVSLLEFREHRRKAMHRDLSEEIIVKLMGVGGAMCIALLCVVIYAMTITLVSFQRIGSGYTDIVQENGDSGGLSELKTRPCNEQPCLNGGFCVTEWDMEPTGYSCVCKDECTVGEHCETMIPGCVSAMVNNSNKEISNTSAGTWIARLKRHVLTDYESLVRPIVSQENPRIDVTVSIGLIQVAAVSPKDGTWTCNIWLRVSWMDPFIKWNSSEWGGISELDLDPTKGELWAPDVSFYNIQNKPLINHKPAFVYSSGYVYYSQPMTVTLACDLSLRDFPYDQNVCGMHIGSWHDHGHEVVMQPGSVQMDGLFIANHEYVISPYKQWQEAKYYPGYPEPWPEVFFTFKLTRHASFYINNLIVPTIAITYLGTLQFYIPIRGASVDRMGLPAALLLSVVAITFLVNENTPVSREITRIQALTQLNLVWLISSMTVTTFVLFLSTVRATLPSVFLRTLLDLIHEDKDNHASVVLDFFSVSLVTKGVKATYLIAKGVIPATTLVTMSELGEVIDLVARLVYPCSYTWVITSTFSEMSVTL